MIVARETVSTVLVAIAPLLKKHWMELSHYPDIPLEPDYDFYARVEKAGNLRIYTVREQGSLIGYGIFIVNHNKHYRSSFQAVQDVLFVDPEHRGTAGVRLTDFIDMELANDGVQVVYQHVKKAHPQLGKLLLRKGYEEVETIYARRLDHGRNSSSSQ